GGDDDAGVVLLHAGEAGAGREVDLALAERPLRRLGQGDVLVRDEVGQRLDDRDVRAEGLPHGGELDADDAAAEHDRALGDVVELERLLAGDDAAADLQAGQGARVGAGGQDDVAAPVGGAVDLDGVRAGEPAPTGDVVDLPGLHQALEALVQAADDAVLVGVDGTHVDALEGAVDADAGALADRVGHLGAVEQRLRRDAAAVQTGTAELVGLDQRDGQPQ